MRKALIIEDEPLSAERLQTLLKGFPRIQVLESLNSVQETLRWFHESEPLDLIFMDIELGDGNAFDILSQIDPFPFVIFTTAYDQHTLEAFKYNSIDYLLKPIKREDLDRALTKFERMLRFDDQENKWHQLREAIIYGGYKQNFLVKRRNQLKSIPVDEIGYFISQNGICYLVEKKGKKWILDVSLDDLQKQIDPHLFFRINRKCIISAKGIETIENYFNARLLIEPLVKPEDPLIVSRDRVKSFKAWLDR